MAWTTHVLVLANRTAGSDELLEVLEARARQGPTAFTILAPATPTGTGRPDARENLELALERMAHAGLQVRIMTGDPDPVAALADVWDPREYDEIVVSTLPTGVSHWLKVDLPQRVARITGVPVQHVTATEARPRPASAPAREPAPRPGVLGALSVLAWGGTEQQDAAKRG